jgi:transposase
MLDAKPSSASVPEPTRRVAHAAFPQGNLYIWLRDEMGEIYHDEDFADLYSSQGQPGISAGQLALVSVMQFLEDLPDRQAADAVRGRIDWKYALGLELEDSGFDHTVLSEFRSRLREGEAGDRLLNELLRQLKEKGWIKDRAKQRSDSTQVLGALRELSRLEAVGEMLRATLNEIALIAPEWLQSWVESEWFERYGKAIEDYRLPKQRSERTAYGEQIGCDGMKLLEYLWQQGTPEFLRRLPKVQQLRQYWVYQYYVDQGQLKLRPVNEMPLSGERLSSPYESDARVGTKRSESWTGYKVHVSETCESDQVHLITHVATTQAQVQDLEQTAIIHQALAQKSLLPSQHFVDAGYVDAELLVSSQQDYGIELIGPVREDTSWQAQQEKAYDLSRFVIDWEHQQVTCPEGHPSRIWRKRQDNRRDTPIITVEFAKPICRDCPVRQLCTRSPTAARTLTLQPQAQQQALQQARSQQASQQWWEHYGLRAGIEGTISQAVVGFGIRQSRYRGLTKTHLQHVMTATAINLKRLFAWVQGVPLARTRVSPFAALSPVPS